MSYFGRKLNTADQDIYITSDLHFWHKTILSFCNKTRPWGTLEEMHKDLVTEWNSKVKPNDIIFHLGDFSFKGKEATDEILSQLNGKKIMILGNHDKVLRNNIKVGEHDIEEICDYLELRIDGVKICMSHFPQSCWNQQGRESLMFHGHTHGSFQGQGKIVDVGYDSFGDIINIKQAIHYCQARPTFCPDHHKIVE
jgi:calcineurin-like phosphoesterase family protein